MKVALVACCKQKRAVPCAAKDLYVSPLFRGSRRYAERKCDRWFILSALHGLLDPEEEVRPYDLCMRDRGVESRRAWGERVLDALLPLLSPRDTIVWLTGREYLSPIYAELAHYKQEFPFAGLPIGRRLQKLAPIPPLKDL